MFDHSRAPSASSKWRQVTGEHLARVDATDKRLHLETQALSAGVALPVRVRRSRAKPGAPVPSSKHEIAGFWAFVALHGREIAPLLARAGGEDQQLRLARCFRDLRNGAPGAHERWIDLLRELDI